MADRGIAALSGVNFPLSRGHRILDVDQGSRTLLDSHSNHAASVIAMFLTAAG
jgi:hypothetical protein